MDQDVCCFSSAEECEPSPGRDAVVEVLDGCFVDVGLGFQLVGIVDKLTMDNLDAATELKLQRGSQVVAVYSG